MQPHPDDATAKKFSNEENKKETEQLHKRSNLLLGILSVYIAFVAAVVALGILAFYSGHPIALQIAFFVSIALLLVVPIGVIGWYLRAFLRKTPAENVASGNRSLTAIILKSSIGRFLVRLGKTRIFKLLTFAVYTYMIADAIRVFPVHPRLSLAIVVFYAAAGFCLALFWVADIIQRDIIEIWKRLETISGLLLTHSELHRNIFDIVAYTHGIAESSRKFLLSTAEFIDDTVESHDKAHEGIVAALKAVNQYVNVVANTTTPKQPAEASPEELANHLGNGDEEPNKS